MDAIEREFEAALHRTMRMLERSGLESEALEFEGEAEFSPIRAARDLWVITGQGGDRDENRLTDAVFYDRHPELKGKLLKNASLALRQEWIGIRDNVVRNYLKTYPAQPAAPAAPMPPPVAPAAAAVQEPFGFSQFSNIRQYDPSQYPLAIAAQNEYRKASAFQTYYNHINILWPRVDIGEDPHGIGNLVFKVGGQEFSDFVVSDELKAKAAEIGAGGVTSEIIFSDDVIGVLGLGLTMLDLARGLENERMLSGTGPENSAWRAKQQLQFAFALMAEDLSREPWGPIQFFNRDARLLAVELATRYAAFQPIYARYGTFYSHEQELGMYQGSPPSRSHDTVGLPPPGL